MSEELPPNTELLRQATEKAFKSVVLRCALSVASAVLIVVLNKLYDWKSAPNITQIDVFILLTSVLLAMCSSWLTYIDRSFARFHEQRERHETEMHKQTEVGWTRAELTKAGQPQPKG